MFKYTYKKFARDIGKIAKSIDSSLEYAYIEGSKEVTLTPIGKVEVAHTIFLENLFLKVSQLSKKERLISIEKFLREAMLPNTMSSEEIMESLSLRVRTDFEVDFRDRHIKLVGHKPTPSILRRHGELLVEVVSDNSLSLIHI